MSSLLLASLTGCGFGPASRTVAAGVPSSIKFSGNIHGGQQPVAGATIQLYTVGLSSDGSASSPLLTQTVTSDGGGAFALTGLFSCTNATLVYLTATGGTPGGFSPNPNLALMTALGPCSSLTPSTFISVNEVTTVAAVNALAPYMSSATAIGSSPSDLSGLTAAFTLASQFANPATGRSPGSSAPAGTTIPTTLINTLADVVAACVNSSGGVAGDPSACGQMFEYTTPGSSPAPTNTVAALLSLANNPTLNTPLLYGLVQPSAPFLPDLPTAPSDFRIRPTPVDTTSLTLTPSVLTFLAGAVGSPSSPLQVTVQNLTPAAVAFSGVSLTGANAADFIDGTNCSATLAVNASCNILVTITPSAAGARIGYLAIANSTPASPQYVTLALNNIAPTLTSINPNSLVSGSATSTNVLLIGTNFLPTSIAQIGGTNRVTTYFSSTELAVQLTIADQANAGTLAMTVINPPPGGGVSNVLHLTLTGAPAGPVISQLIPSTFNSGSGTTYMEVTGSNLTSSTVVKWNGASLATQYGYSPYGGYYLYATIPGSLLTSPGTASVTAYNALASSTTSNALTATIVLPPAPTLTAIYPGGGAVGTATAVTLNGTGFTGSSIVALNGITIPSSFVSSTQITATFPAANVATPGNINVTVTTPAPGGGTTAAQVYSVYVSLPNNDLVYNPADGMLYASVPASAAGGPGNSIVAIDPLTGLTTRTIQVGTNPNKLALSTDGTQLFVGLDGAASVAQVNLAKGTIVNQFYLGGGPGVYNAPYTAAYLAAVPGLPNSVAVSTTGQYGNGSGVTIFDSGVARTGSSVTVPGGPLSFGTSASTLYVGASYIDALTVGPTGITKLTQLASNSSYSLANIQYDNGALYLAEGQVLNASSGVLNGTFYTTATNPANGPIVSDSTLGKAFVAASNYSSNAGIYVFDEGSFNLLGIIPLNNLGSSGYPTSFRKIVRWGQNGLAAAAVPSAFTSANQIYIVQSPLVKDVSAAPADLSLSLSAPATAATGAAMSYTAKITNAGPNTAVGVTLSAALDPSLIVSSITAGQGSCTTAATFSCDLGGLASGASVTVTVNAMPTSAGTLSATGSVSSSSFDPIAANNQASASTTVTGGLYGAVPSIASISPNLVQAGSAAFTLSVTGAGFNTSSMVSLGGTALTTTYVSPTQLTASVAGTAIANYGWAPVTVANPMPGGGLSAVAPLSIYGLVNVPATSILFDPYGQSLYATIPSTAAGILGNSVVAINPSTGAIGTPIAVGSQPNMMTETSDGTYIYVGLSGADSLAQFNLLSQSLAATIPLKYSSTSVPALSLTTMPGTDTTLAVGFSGFAEQFGIFDVNGTTGSFRSNISGIYSGNNPVFASPTELYAYDSQTSGAEFYRYNVTTNGLTFMDGTTLNGIGGFNGGIQPGNGLIYGEAGGIINPTTTPPSQVQTLPLIDFYGSGSVGYGTAVAADPSLNKDFLMLVNDAGTWAYGLVRYDLKSYLPEASITMPVSASGVGSTWTLQRFGQDGLAMLSYNTNYSGTPAVQLLLLRGPFVAPQELGISAAATLSSSSVSTIAHGSGNTMLTLTGSNFLPGVAVTWNGSYRTTTIVDATHVSVAIPASDLAKAAAASVVATNPGASASNALQVTIN